ncbi:hypothetical protein [Pseudooctadecabacter jejudonensis]|uniref:Membrane transport protein MMPL domain-containing protein n=1 Tax=Pseudooctadecabacter jejudonensis TaxID=1391910 RepID=A0A1Y5RHD9_9RHOB|nr:hypothetical protein [Pseudooctadecabacter jejudonensis]SLN14732.1 hypothetical protein PSJ8397_00297 [Pseudooctadecabacter jejudonensis]
MPILKAPTECLSFLTPPILFTTLIVASGCATLMVSDIPALSQAGVVLAVAAVTALVCDLFLLPSFLVRQGISGARR